MELVPATQLAVAIEHEYATLEEFCALLATEQNLLLSGKTSPLIPLAEEKTRLAERLLQHSTLRQELAHGLPSLPPELTQRLTSLRSRASEAERTNSTNGELIQIRLRHNLQALNILQQASHTAALYGPNGLTQISGQNGRTLAQG